ncbi:2-oxoglutarate and iron-dependent oxygenase domain-containing protein [Streptomyces sp. NPDC020807]|uniref:2-oxoglutarate and iron-dependent oxygenase domain-containing protein n=1 Tax=Streptomyces sp. NPDC020807 TaxID=3155119 RepID=UPI0033E030C8
MIPVITLADLEAQRPEALELLHTSLRENTLVHVDARRELGDSFFPDLYGQTRAFFALPEADKQALDINASPNYRGYVSQGTEYTNGVPDLKESFEFGKETPAPEGEQLHWYGLYGENQWPAEESLPGFRAVVDAYSAAMDRIALATLSCLQLTLDQPIDPEKGVTGGELCSFSRLIRYRDPKGFGAEETRLERHTDSGLLTIGLQNAAGLEAESTSGEWLSVEPPADVFTVFPGELMEIWTHGYYRACAHRVRNAALTTERLSYASFFLPDLQRELVPMDRALSPRLSGPLSVPSANSWLTGTSELPESAPIGQLEWDRMNVIFPGRETANTGAEKGEVL